MSLQGLLLLLITVPNFVVGSIVLARDRKSVTNFFFSVFAFSAGMWSLGLAGFLYTSSESMALNIAKSYYLSASVVIWSFFMFSICFTNVWTSLSKNVKLLFVLPLVAMCLAIVFVPDFILTGIAYRDWGKEVLLDRVDYALYILYFGLFVSGGFIIIAKKLLSSKGVERLYLKFVFIGLAIAFGFGGTFNLIYPALGNYRYIWVGPLFTVAYIAFISYAIIKHELFDIRFVLARSLGYIASVTILASLFGAVAFNVLALFLFKDLNLSISQQGVFIFLFIMFSMMFQPLKTFFDSYTVRIFYRDHYETQDFLDSFNKVMVSTIDLDQLLVKAQEVIGTYMKLDFIAFAMRGNAKDTLEVVSDSAPEQLQESIEKIRHLIQHSGVRVVVTDDLDEGSDIKHLLRDLQVGLIARIATQSAVEGSGYIIFGNKKSGNIYEPRDVNTIAIIANEMAIAIQNAYQFQEIQKFNVTLQEKIDDATRELKRTNEKLIALDEAKDEFVSMASHQLRTPLTSIKGYVSMVAEEDMGKLNHQQKKMLGQALFSSQRMVYLISDLLNVSRLKTGKFVIEPKPVHLPTVIESELTQLHEGAAAKDIALTYHGPKEFPILYLDEMKIRQVIMNFTDNAIYYTPSGGKITLTLKENPQSVEFTVKDTGIGVPKDERHKLFTKFYRANNAKQARPDGTGLGLFMAKKVIIAQGGSVVFDSVEGKGSTFGFNFPKSAVKVPEGVVVDKKKVMTSVGSEAMPEPSLED